MPIITLHCHRCLSRSPRLYFDFRDLNGTFRVDFRSRLMSRQLRKEGSCRGEAIWQIEETTDALRNYLETTCSGFTVRPRDRYKTPLWEIPRLLWYVTRAAKIIDIYISSHIKVRRDVMTRHRNKSRYEFLFQKHPPVRRDINACQTVTLILR